MTLELFLREHGIGFEKHAHHTTYTSQALAEAEHVSGYHVAKPVVVKAGGQFAMCVVPAPRHVDLEKVRSLLKAPDVRLASEEEMKTLFEDCEVGAEPPIGKLYGLATIMDEELKKEDFLVMQAGTHTDAVKLRREDWEKVAEPTCASVCRGRA